MTFDRACEKRIMKKKSIASRPILRRESPDEYPTCESEEDDRRLSEQEWQEVLRQPRAVEKAPAKKPKRSPRRSKKHP